MGNAVDLLHGQTTLGGIAEIKLDNILILAADIGGLRCGINDMVAVTGQLLDNIGANLQAGNGKGAVDAGFIGADDSAAGARTASEVLDLEDGVGDGLAGHAIVLIDHQSGKRDVLKGDALTGPSFDIDLLRGGLLHGVAGSGLGLGDLVPAVLQVGEGNHTVLIGGEVAQGVDLPGEGVVAGIGDGELGPLNGIAGYTVHLVDGETGLGIVLELHRRQLVGNKGDELMLLVQQVVGGDGLLPDFHHTGLHVGKEDLAVAVGGLGGDGAPIGHLDGEGNTLDRFAGDGVGLHDSQVGLRLVGDHKLALLAGEEFNMVLGGVEHITRGGRQLLHGVDTGLQGGNGNAAIGIRYPVEVVTAILHLGDAECGPGQIVAGVGVILDRRRQ